MSARALLLLLVGVALAAVACSGTASTAPTEPSPSGATVADFGPAPTVPDGPVADDVATDLDIVFASLAARPDVDAAVRLGAADDARIAWLLADILRFSPAGDFRQAVVGSWSDLTGVTVDGGATAWGEVTDHMLAWDTPAPPGYVGWKRQVFELIEPGWAPFFDDQDATIDWRLVSWGGVLIDDRPVDETDQPCPRGCIPALNDPALVPAAEGGWYDDDAVVFGVEIDGVAVAFPKNIMEVHEMVNTTLAGRRIGLPYCTLCGSAQAYFTDEVSSGDRPHYELRTSGLLSRSNKVMYEFHTGSVFDTFTGEAVTGPLREQGVVLEQVTVTTSTWGDWKMAHPDTSIVAEDGGIGRTYPADPLQGRDANGPIFPVGDVDPRLGVQDSVVGVIGLDGTPVAFAVAGLDAATGTGPVVAGGVVIESDGAGFTAQDETSGSSLAAHEAFWFAWSQFHPDTELWLG
ncbi:MAG: DUF3179 domain-containing (seleno)protein [Acidimicrobiales bacterium]